MYAIRNSYPFRLTSLKRWLLVVAIGVSLAIGAIPTLAQDSVPPGNKVDGYPVVLGGEPLFRVRVGIPGVVSPEERAQVITQRLSQVANDAAISLEAFQVREDANESLIQAGDTVLFTIRDADAKAMGKPRQALAKEAVEIMQTAVGAYREERSLQKIIWGVVFAVLSTIGLLIFFQLLQRVVTRLLTKVKAARKAKQLNLQIRDFRILGSDATSYLLSGAIRLLRLVLILAALYLYLPFFLSQFPTTREFGNSILSQIAAQVQTFLEEFARYLPKLFAIGIIAFITNYVIDFAKLVIIELGRDDAFSWFYPEWVKPTIRLVSLCIMAIACVIAAPYLPGFGSPAFQGISLFLGALFTLGSSSAISNAIAGIILIYTRAFRIDDIIRIGDITGKVIDKSLFVTRIARFPQEIVVIPNATVLSGNLTNFSSVQRTTGGYLALHSTVTLGYDVPWRTVEDVLVKAAIATSGILTDPSPFVLQTGLNDFNVSYQINAFTDCPEIMPVTYTKLHQNIQDCCNAAGIEIMSPNYLALRDGNHSTIPSDYLASDYQSPGFQVQNQNGDR
ncbi:MAG: mechanosensitive ion channel [Leptolyngbyaceae cyanobacterium bins.302]|nr:mechanosensitive ion channel [Leptolyngbyaceae cyanobacterium bins.302]